ncbi:hypothetical protein HK097_001488 [Rhizophlyctis rosea]|uniref:Alkaline phosphatase n=1 Tax=Rhizophlyctis rosea TaxID=64517 RepID=A0AAD5XA27_9FUNG|nr:hypothetical protein HK097_001488 [Rhizophlyctis rosea]
MARNYYQVINNKPYGTQLPLDTILGVNLNLAPHIVTDSAAGATAFACAIKTYNGAIGVDPEQRACGTVLEAAKAVGYTTGFVVTSRVTHATPASFSAHVINRNFENQIALQQIGNYTLGRNVDLMFGGGLCHFKPIGDPMSCRLDNINVLELAQQSGWSVGTDRQSFEALADTSSLPLLQVFTKDHMSFEIDRDPKKEPSLKEMAIKALSILTENTKKSDKGFFLMIEGSRIDMAGHNNDPASHVREILAYNEAIEAVKAYVEQNSDTTVMISVSDHETGGLSVARQLNATYPVYQWHPEALRDVKRSTEIIAPLLVTFTGTDRRAFVTKTVLKEWLAVSDITEEEIKPLLDPTRDASQITSQLGLIISRRAELGWATHGHSAVDVNLYAYGLNSKYLRGNHENTDIGHFIISQLGLDLDPITEKLRKDPPRQSSSFVEVAAPYSPIHYNH